MKQLLQNHSRKLLLTFKIVLSVGLIGYFLWKLSLQAGGFGPMISRLGDTMRNADPLFLLLAMSLHPVGYALTSWRWSTLLSPFGDPPPFSRLYRLYFMAAFLNNFTFGTVGGDALRAVAGKRFSNTLTRSTTIVLIEHLSGFGALYLIALAGLTVQTLRGRSASWVLGLAAVGLLAAAALIARLLRTRIGSLPEAWRRRVPGRFGALLDHLIETLAAYRNRPAALVKALGISLIFQTSMVFYYFLICRAMGADLSLASALTGIPVLIIMLMIIPAVNGIGVRTTGFGSLLGMSAATALSGEGVDILFRLFFGLIGGILFVSDRSRKQSPFPGSRSTDEP